MTPERIAALEAGRARARRGRVAGRGSALQPRREADSGCSGGSHAPARRVGACADPHGGIRGAQAAAAKRSATVSQSTTFHHASM